MLRYRLQDNFVVVKGLAEDVEACVSVIAANASKAAQSKVKPCPRELCRW